MSPGTKMRSSEFTPAFATLSGPRRKSRPALRCERNRRGRALSGPAIPLPGLNNDLHDLLGELPPLNLILPVTFARQLQFDFRDRGISAGGGQLKCSLNG